MLFIVASAFFITVLITGSAIAQWENKVIKRLTEDTIWNATVRHPIHTDNQGRLFVGFRQVSYSTETRIFYQIRDSVNGWSQPVEAGYDTSYRAVGYVAMAVSDLDSSVWVCFSYLKLFEGEYISVLRLTGDSVTEWVIDTLMSIGDLGRSMDIEVDSLGNVHLVWYRNYWDSVANENKKHLVYAVYYDATWHKQTVGDTTTGANPGQELPLIFLSLTGSGRAYIGANAAGYFYPQYNLMRNDTFAGTSWEKFDSISAPYFFNDMGGMQVDKDENLHVLLNAFDVYPGGDKYYIYYYKRNNSTGQWLIQDLLTDEGKPLSFFVDGLNDPHAAWTHWSGYFTTDNVIYANKKSGFWQSSELLRYDELYPYTFDFLIDGEGRGHGIFTGYGSEAGWAINDSVEIYYIYSNPLGIDQPPVVVPKAYETLVSYPNPFNSSVKIEYYLQGRSEVSLRIYNVLGKEVRNLIGEKVTSAGRHLISWDGKDDYGVVLASGVYFCFLEADQQKYTRKIILIR